MLSLGNIQAQIVNDLISCDLKNREIKEGQNYIQLEYQTDIKNISDLIGHFHCYPKFYFRNKEQSAEFLSLGAWQTFKSLYEYEEITSITENNDFIIATGAQRFQHENKTVEWHGLEDCHFFIPKVFIEHCNDSICLKLNIPKDVLTSSEKKKEYLHEIATTLDPHTISYKDHNNYPILKTSFPNKQEWNNIVDKSLNLLKSTELDKVVLSRKNIIKYNKQVCAEDIFLNTKENSQDAYICYFQVCQNQTFISYSPETLFKVKDHKLHLDSLAGTRPRGYNKAADNLFKAELLNNQKELTEHRCVTNYISNKMTPFVEEVKITDKESILSLKYVQHIHTKLNGTLNNNIKLIDLLHTFHPTPAVGGAPKESAMDIIKELEPFSRGFYASPLGYLTKGNAEFCVGIRSCLINNNTIHIYGGCGLVEGSDSKEEWLETKNKMKNFNSVIEGAR